MTCGTCGASQGAGDRFCGDCGAPLGGCPSCGEPAVAGKRFCHACGAALSAADRPSPAGAVLAPRAAAVPGTGGLARPVPVAERRVCSVLFCDLVGFTPLSESRDPEAVRELLSQYFAVARTVIGRYGGAVEKFIGDAVMAVWGTPVATEGDAERAVRAALDLVAAVAALGTEAGVPGLAARAGLVTGKVAVTLGAVAEGMVAGDAVNTAARVQSAAGAGQVLADAATQRLAAGAVGFADAGEHTLKGKAEPQALWQATRVLAGVGGVQRVDGLEAPLTGRDADLRTIKELFHAAADRAVPRMVMISGPAGVGKSRLGWEFEKYADGLAADVWWHRGRCLSYGDGVAFWALAEIIRQRLGIAEDDPADIAAGKLAAGMDRFVPDPAERAYVGVRLGRLLGLTATGDAGGVLARDELFAGWRLFLERLAAAAPVVLLIEDAQHADIGLLDFLDYLTDWVRGLPIYILVLARPELSQARPGFGTGRNRTTLTLDPLDPASMDGLVDVLVPGMPAAARTAITRHAQGIPLFDRDIVQSSEGAYRLVGAVGELRVPDSLRALLAARLDALDPAVRRLAADAAILGTSFSAETLIAMSGQDEAPVRWALADLLRREVLSVSADPLSPERGSYQFAQDMLRQVAYDTLSRRDRKTRHLEAASHLRATFPGDGDEIADVIARHYLDALIAIPDDPDTGHIRLQAVDALIRAAERADRTGAPARAATSYAAAAQLAADPTPDIQTETSRGQPEAGPPPDAGALWEKAARAAMADAAWAVAIEHADRAREHHLRLGHLRGAASAQVTAGAALSSKGRFAEAREQLAAALDVLRAAPDADTVRALENLAGLEVFAGSPDADRLTTEALALGQALNTDVGRLAGIFSLRGVFHGMADRRPQAIAYFREAARLATQADDNASLGTILVNLSDVLGITDPAAAAEAAKTAIGYFRLTGNRNHLPIAVVNAVLALLLIGDRDASDSVLAEALDSDGLAEIELLSCLKGWLAALRGDTDTAAAMLAALPDLRASEDLQDRATISVTEGFHAAARRQPGEALWHARAALTHADALGMSHACSRWAWPLAARAASEMGDTATVDELLVLLDSHQPGHLPPMLQAERDLARARLAGPDPAAGASFAAAMISLRGGSTPYHLAHGLLDHAQYLGDLGNVEAVATALAEASDIARKLRCQLLLDRAAAMTPAEPRTLA